MVAPVGKSGAGDDLEELVELDCRVVDPGDNRVADSPRLCGRDARRHPDGDPPEPLTSRLGNLPGKTRKPSVLLVVARLEVDGVEFDVLEHLGGDRADLASVYRIAAGEAVDRPEVPCPGDQQVAHVPPLLHPGRGRDRSSCHRAGGTASSSRRRSRALAGRSPERQTEVEHRHQDPPLRGLPTIAYVRQGVSG